jgi:hypothetical protein
MGFHRSHVPSGIWHDRHLGPLVEILSAIRLNI